jgi:hypothetical protein
MGHRVLSNNVELEGGGALVSEGLSVNVVDHDLVVGAGLHTSTFIITYSCYEVDVLVVSDLAFRPGTGINGSAVQSRNHPFVLESLFINFPKHPVLVLPAAHHVFPSAVKVQLCKNTNEIEMTYTRQLIHALLSCMSKANRPPNSHISST